MIAAILLTLLQLADAWTTHRVISKGGRELNPILAWLFNQIGHIAGLIIAKGGVILILWLALPAILALPAHIGAISLWVLVAAYVVAVGNNLRAMEKQS